MVNALRREREGSLDVIEFKVRKLLDNLRVRKPCRQQIEDINHADAKAPNARPTTTLSWLRGDAFETVTHFTIIPQITQQWNSGRGALLALSLRAATITL